MSDPGATHSERSARKPRPIVRTHRWPLLLVWLVPLFAAGMTGYYFYHDIKNRGPLIAVSFPDAGGLKAGQSQLIHLGVAIGQVQDIELGANDKQAVVHIRVNRENGEFAAKGATFWIVRPEISAQEISGLATVLSGPYIDATPGSGQTQTEFTGLQSPPLTRNDGLRIVLKTPHTEHLQPDSPVLFRGIQVGAVESIELNSDSASVNIHTFIERRFAPLVRSGSQFWLIDAVDVKGSLLGGVQLKVGPISSLLSGGITFATPEKKMGDAATDGADFALYDEPKKEWLDWAPKIAIDTNVAQSGSGDTTLPHAPDVVRSAVGAK